MEEGKRRNRRTGNSQILVDIDCCCVSLSKNMRRVPKLVQSLNNLLNDARLEEEKPQLRSQDLANSSESISQGLSRISGAPESIHREHINIQDLEAMLQSTRYHKIGDTLVSIEKRLQAMADVQNKEIAAMEKWRTNITNMIASQQQKGGNIDGSGSNPKIVGEASHQSPHTAPLHHNGSTCPNEPLKMHITTPDDEEVNIAYASSPGDGGVGGRRSEDEFLSVDDYMMNRRKRSPGYFIQQLWDPATESDDRMTLKRHRRV